jgi:hypothetical protein
MLLWETGLVRVGAGVLAPPWVLYAHLAPSLPDTIQKRREGVPLHFIQEMRLIEL